MEAASEPLSGSVVASAVSGGSGAHSGATQRSACSGVPSASTGSAKKPFEVSRLPIPAQPWESSSCTRQPVRQSVRPPPPSASGSMKEVSPSSAAAAHSSAGCSVSASSTARETGRISRAANSRQTRWISRCSSESAGGITRPRRQQLVAGGEQRGRRAVHDGLGPDRDADAARQPQAGAGDEHAAVQHPLAQRLVVHAERRTARSSPRRGAAVRRRPRAPRTAGRAPPPRARAAPRRSSGRPSEASPAASAARLTLNGSCTAWRKGTSAAGGERVAEAQAGEPEDLAERAQHHDAAALGDVALAARPLGGRDVVHVRLVGDHEAAGRHAVEQRLPLVRRPRASPVGLFGSQIHTMRASVSRAAARRGARGRGRSSAARHRHDARARHLRGLGVEAVGELRDHDRVARAHEGAQERDDQRLDAVAGDDLGRRGAGLRGDRLAQRVVGVLGVGPRLAERRRRRRVEHARAAAPTGPRSSSAWPPRPARGGPSARRGSRPARTGRRRAGRAGRARPSSRRRLRR